MVASRALELIDNAIAELEGKLNLPPGGSLSSANESAEETTPTTTPYSNAPTTTTTTPTTTSQEPPPQTKKEKKAKNNNNNEKNKNKNKNKSKTNAPANVDQPDICKLEFKVGVITKVWAHPDADKLYCEEIDVGEDQPRQIASGLRPYYTEAQMLGQRLLVIANLKAKNLVGFKSHGMVLCGSLADPNGDGERVEFVEPPPDAPIGERVTFEGLPPPEPFSGAQVDKKKLFGICAPDLHCTDTDGVATWKGHAFLTSAGPCRCPTLRGAMLH